MEVARHTKKLKKRRYRSSDMKSERSSELTFDQPSQALPVEESKCGSKHAIEVENQLVQTDHWELTGAESKEALAEKEEQIRALTDRLQQAQSKLHESTNSLTALRQDYDKAQKMLCSEIGEDATAGSGWRGRAEQISQLQRRLADLQQKVAEGAGGPRRKAPDDTRTSASVRLLEQERRLRDGEASLDRARKRHEAAKARVAVLEGELTASRRAVVLLNEKTLHDNQLIEALHEELEAAGRRHREAEAAARRQADGLEREGLLVRAELEAAHIRAGNLARQLEDQRHELERLREKVSWQEARPARSPQRNRADSRPGSPAHSCTREANEYIAIGIAAEAERERLLELVTVLNRRLDKESLQMDQLSESFRKERSRAAKLETRLQKVELERAGLSRVRAGSYRTRLGRPLPGGGEDLGDPEENHRKLELLREECLALRTRLATTQKDKAADLAAFKKMLEQTRKIFKDAYRGKLPTIGCHSAITV